MARDLFGPPQAADPVVTGRVKVPPPPPPPGRKKKKASGPPAPPPPPPSQKKNVSTTAAFNGFINAHPTMRPYADTIAKWARFYGVDETVMAALFWKESFAAATAAGKDPSMIESPTGQGVGIGQINPNHVGSKTPWGATVSQSDLTNPEFNIRWSTWFFSQALAQTGNIDTAYSEGYNPGYTGPALSKLLPANYVPSSSLNPGQKASAGTETKAAADALKDPWVVLGKDGSIHYVNSPTPPKNVLTYGGAPVSRNGLFAGSASFNSVWGQTYADQFQAFTGRKATGKEIQQILKNAPSVYALQTELAGRPTFTKSPIWKANADGYIGLAKQIMGNKYKPPTSMIAEAITDNWTQADFEQKIRELPSYTSSVEYKTNYASIEQTYESVYGSVPDDDTRQLIADVTKRGWTTQQFQSWLTHQDVYKLTPAYKAKQLTFLTQLGLITGANPTLSAADIDKMETAGDSLKIAPPATPPVPGQPGAAPGSSPQNPTDKPTGVGPTGYGSTFTPTRMVSGEAKNEAPFTRKVA